jgi:hypothetical protein
MSVCVRAAGGAGAEERKNAFPPFPLSLCCLSVSPLFCKTHPQKCETVVIRTDIRTQCCVVGPLFVMLIIKGLFTLCVLWVVFLENDEAGNSCL